jgi:zinc protease
MKKNIYMIIVLFWILIFNAMVFADTTISFEVNGLKVILRQNIASDVVATGLYLRGGATYISSGMTGIENMALAVAQKATLHHPKEQLQATLESMNTQISHTVDKDYSSLDMQCVRQNLTSSWQIFSDILVNPLFTPEDTELERQRILAEIRQRVDDPDDYLDQICDQAFFIDHPYMNNVNGTEETITSFSAEQLHDYWQKRTQTSQLLLVVVGNISQKELEPLVRETFTNLQKGEYSYTIPPAVWPTQPSVKLVYRDMPTNYIKGYFTAPSYGSQERLAMLMAGRILYRRVFEEVRTKRSLSYAPSVSIGGNFSNYAFLYVTAVDADSATRVMIRELDHIKRVPVEQKLLRDEINLIITRYYRSLETNASQVQMLARYELSGAGYSLSERFKERLIELTPQDIKQVCQKYIKNIQFVVLGNPEKMNVHNYLYSGNL